MVSSLSRKSIISMAVILLFLCVAGISFFSLSVKARNANQTEILVDENSNAVQIIVGGKVVAIIDESGLRVDGIVITNTGPLNTREINRNEGKNDTP